MARTRRYELAFNWAANRPTPFTDAVTESARRHRIAVLSVGRGEVAGVVGDVHSDGLHAPPPQTIYMPLRNEHDQPVRALTVAVRAIAMKDLGPWNAMRFIGKEILVGGVNGVIFAILMGLIAWLWFSDPLIGIIIGIAMVVNLVVAAFFGTLIPLGLERLKIDPAVASGVFLTTVTDVVGFFAFLGLAAAVLL